MTQEQLITIAVSLIVGAIVALIVARFAQKPATELTDSLFAKGAADFAQLAVSHAAKSKADRLAAEQSAAVRELALQQALAKASAALAPVSAPTA